MGTLYLVATPIGNLEDITLRALRVLKEAERILAEDTRESAKLLNAHGITMPAHGMHAFHDHNEAEMTPRVLRWLAEGAKIAVISDAGTPGISDPGFRLVRAARDAGESVVPIPGPCAAVAALSASGLPTDRFTFAGFPPKREGALTRWLADLENAPGSVIAYLAAREVPDVLRALVSDWRDPVVCVYRELTKVYEEALRGAASAVLADWEQNPRRGEVTLIIGQRAEVELDDAALSDLLSRGSIDEVRASTGVSKKRLYALKLQAKRGDDGSR